MFSLRSKLTLMALVLAALFSYGLVKLFLLRFEAGDVYPPYSSMRSDPLGTRALFEGLEQMGGGMVRRHFQPLTQIDFTPGRTVLLCGLSADTVWQMRSRTWEKMITTLENRGGRLILSFKATSQRFEQDDDSYADAREEQPPAKEEDESGEDLEERDRWQGLEELGLAIERATGRGTQQPALRAAADSSIALPDNLPWRGALFFEPLEDSWQVLYTLDQQAVIVQRPWGRGTLVMVADSYLFSNEAMRKDRHADLLTWLLVPGHEVVFGESHLGLFKQPGIAGLALKYRLHGVIAVGVLVALLLVWQQTAVFVPVTPPDEDQEVDRHYHIGRDTAEGLVHLMRQHIAPDQVLTVCHENWLNSPAINHVSEEKIKPIKALLEDYQQAPRAHNPVEVYRHICQLLKQGKRIL